MTLKYLFPVGYEATRHHLHSPQGSSGMPLLCVARSAEGELPLGRPGHVHLAALIHLPLQVQHIQPDAMQVSFLLVLKLIII